MQYYIQTFGCKVSQYESQAMRESWQKKFKSSNEVENPKEANLLVIASCAVTREGVTDARQLCNKWRREFPKAHIIVTGCAAEVAKEDFKNADAIIPQKIRHMLLEKNPLELQGYYEFEKKLSYPPFFIEKFKRSRPVVKVQDGCSHLCSYCIVPYTRGPSRSRPLHEILLEIQRLLENGYREIVLSGINLRQYDYDGLDYWDITNAIQEKFASNFEHKARFRLSSLEPAQLNEKGIASITRSKLIAPHIHLSLQSGSPSVLKRMNREHYELCDIEKSLELLEKKWSYFGLGADFLLGFPGESDEEFNESVQFIKKIPFTYAHVFPYSIRPNTRAAQMKNQIEKQIKQERTQKVREIIQEKQDLFLERIIKTSKLEISFDISSHENDTKNNLLGIDQYYNNCLAHGKVQGHGLIEAKPKGIQDHKILVEIKG